VATLTQLSSHQSPSLTWECIPQTNIYRDPYTNQKSNLLNFPSLKISIFRCRLLFLDFPKPLQIGAKLTNGGKKRKRHVRVLFDDILSILSELEHRINLTMPLLSLGEAIVKQRGEELVQSVTKILNTGANVNDISWNGHGPLQLLIKAKMEPRKKLELVKRLVSLGADIHSADKSGLTPYQVAISEKNKSISDLLRSKDARPMSSPGTGYAKNYDKYNEIPLP
jgi:ankyrin repeat protein